MLGDMEREGEGEVQCRRFVGIRREATTLLLVDDEKEERRPFHLPGKKRRRGRRPIPR